MKRKTGSDDFSKRRAPQEDKRKSRAAKGRRKRTVKLAVPGGMEEENRFLQTA